MSAPSRGTHIGGAEKISQSFQHPVEEAESILEGATTSNQRVSHGNKKYSVSSNNGHDDSFHIDKHGSYNSVPSTSVDSQHNLPSGKINLAWDSI